VEAVEIDPEVIEVGRRFFKLDRYPQVEVHAADARRYLVDSSGGYDLIFGDVYNGLRYIPHHLVTREFFELVKHRLAADGLFMMNVISRLTGDESLLFRSICRTLKEVFSHVYVFGLDRDLQDPTQQVILLASQRDLSQHLEAEAGEPGVSQLLRTFVPPDEYSCGDAPVFTDHYNPVEYIVARSLGRRQPSRIRWVR
jgi:spermidine synthase